MTTARYYILTILLSVVPAISSPEARAQDSDEVQDPESLFWQRLDEIRAPENHTHQVPRGTFQRSHHVTGSDRTFHYTVDVPASYDPQRQTDVHVYLHGGVGISSNRITNVKLRRLKRLKIEGAISVYPSAWSSAEWWYESQADNVSAVTLLISSDHFDLSKNIQVINSGEKIFDRRIRPDVHVLDKWFEVDRDKSMLFAGEIHLGPFP